MCGVIINIMKQAAMYGRVDLKVLLFKRTIIY